MTRSLVFFASALPAILVSGCFDLEMPDKMEMEFEWCDDVSELCWQNPSEDQSLQWQEAVDYCDGLTFASRDDWRLPTISDLRSFVRGCDATMTGGACGVTDECLEDTCGGDNCYGCEGQLGPGCCGCFWDAEVIGDCEGNWSSSNTDDSNFAWYLDYHTGNVNGEGKSYNSSVRCVRDGPDADTDTDTDTGPLECNLGTYSGDFSIGTQSDVASLAGYTSISGNLTIECSSCTDLSELVCLTSVGFNLEIHDNAALTNLDGLSGITSVDSLFVSTNTALTNLDGLSALNSVVEGFQIYWNGNLPDCEACDLLDQLATAPNYIEVHDNLDDTCTPVPGNCP